MTKPPLSVHTSEAGERDGTTPTTSSALHTAPFPVAPDIDRQSDRHMGKWRESQKLSAWLRVCTKRGAKRPLCRIDSRQFAVT